MIARARSSDCLSGQIFDAVSGACATPINGPESRLLTIHAHDRVPVGFSWDHVAMRIVGFLAVLGGLAAGLLAWMAAAGAQSSGRLACNDFPPHKIEHPGPDGLLGFDVDIVSEAMKRIGRTIETSYMPWKRALELTGRGDYDGLCSCSYARDR